MYSLVEMLTTIALTVLVYMLAWFLLAVLLKRRDVVDSAWGLGFIVVASTAYSLRNNETAYALFTLLLVTTWGARLFLHISSRNWKKKEDYRYAQMGQLGSAQFWVRTFFSVFLLQGALMILISSPIIAVMNSTAQPIEWLAIAGLIIWLTGIITEATGDYQLRSFLRSGKKGIMQTGLWKYSRHPNYFGEITSWWGAAVVAVAFSQWWGILGAWVITILIVKISGIPLLEKRYAKDKAYQAYAKRTSILIPLPVKNGKK